MSSALETPILAKPETLLRVPVGLSSPLWGFYAGAAASGAAWWWMTRWARTENLEAMFAAAETAPALTPPVADVAEAEPPVQAAADAVVDPPVLDAPVGGEAAPIAPAVAAGEPKPRAKRAEPKPD